MDKKSLPNPSTPDDHRQTNNLLSPTHTDPELQSPISEENPARKHRKSVTYQQLTALFECPIREAAARLQISVTHMKRLCREFGINRWPYRKLSSIQRSITVLMLERDSACNSKLQKLEKEKETIKLNPETVARPAKKKRKVQESDGNTSTALPINLPQLQRSQYLPVQVNASSSAVTAFNVLPQRQAFVAYPFSGAPSTAIVRHQITAPALASIHVDQQKASLPVRIPAVRLPQPMQYTASLNACHKSAFSAHRTNSASASNNSNISYCDSSSSNGSGSSTVTARANYKLSIDFLIDDPKNAESDNSTGNPSPYSAEPHRRQQLPSSPQFAPIPIDRINSMSLEPFVGGKKRQFALHQP